MKSNTSAANFIKNYNDYRSNYFCHLRFLESSTKSSIDIFSVVGENSYAKDKLRKIYFPSDLRVKSLHY